VNSYDKFEVAIPPKDVKEDLTELKAIVAKRTADDVFRFHWWAAGGPVYRWNEIIIDELPDNFVTLPLAARHLALFHAALDDAVAVAWHHGKSAAWPDPIAIDTLVKATVQVPRRAPRPSHYAAAAAADVLAYIFPARGKVFAAKAEEAMQLRLLAGVEYPSDVVAGRAIGQKVAPWQLREASRINPMPSGLAVCPKVLAGGRAQIPSRR